MEAVESMEMVLGGQSPSRQGAGTGTSDPRNLSSMAAALRNSFWNMTDSFRVFASEAINRRNDDGQWRSVGPSPRCGALEGAVAPPYG